MGGLNFSDSSRWSLFKHGKRPSLLSALPWEDDWTERVDKTDSRESKCELTVSKVPDLVCRCPREMDDREADRSRESAILG